MPGDRPCPHCKEPMVCADGVLTVALSDGGTLTINPVPVWRCEPCVVVGFDGAVYTCKPDRPEYVQ